MVALETRDTTDQFIGTGTSLVDQEIFHQYKPAQFTVANVTYAFPVIRIQETGGNRLIERERPYRNGAKLDDTGSKAKRWTLECMFENSISDAGLSTINKNVPLYPDVLNALVALFDTHETGDLVVPTSGKRRARAETYGRVESSELRDCAMLTLTFVEDNEDSVDATSITAVTANANARRLSESTEFDVQAAGAWSGSLADLSQFVADLEGLANAPGEYQQTLRQSAKKIQGDVERAKQAFQRPGRQGRDLMNDPSNSRAERKMVQQQEIAARAANNARKGRPKIVQVVFRDPMSLFKISVIVGQDFDELIVINPQLDPFGFIAGTAVNIYATQELLNGQRQTA
jgi:prophage DNA circulation protein